MNSNSQQTCARLPNGNACWLPALRLLLLTSVLMQVWYTGAAATSGVALELRASAEVSGLNYTVADVASYSGGDPQLWEQLAAEPLGAAPRPGTWLTLQASKLLGILAERGYDWRAISLGGSGSVTVYGTQQSVSAESIRQLIASGTADLLGVDLALEPVRELPGVDLAAGELQSRLRCADKPGQWLPDAVEFYVDNRLAHVLPLRNYLNFTLDVLIAPAGITARTAVAADMLGWEKRTLKPGDELVTDPALVCGLETGTSLGSGERLRLSRLKVPWDVTRGTEVTLLISATGVKLYARAKAVSNAYLGQELLVERLDNGEKYKGRLQEGPLVVVE